MNEKNFNALDREIIFKGCTRPAMVLGVPIVPFIVGIGGSFLLLFVIMGIPWTILSIFLWYAMRVIVKEDDQRFRAIGIEFLTIVNNPNKKLWGVITFQPVSFRKSK
jgi:type IV secretion system protein VirB3